MLVVVGLLTVVAFPLFVVSLATRSGGRHLALVTALLLGSLVLAGLALASPRFGNRLSATEGYWPIAGGILLSLGLEIALPIVLSAVTIHLVSGRRAGRTPVVSAAIGTALVGWIVGTVVWFTVAWR